MSWCVLHWESYVKLFGIQLQEYLFFFCCPLYFLLHIGGSGYIEIHMLYVYCEFWLNSFTKLCLTVDCSGPISPSPCGLFYKNIFLLWKFKALFCFFFFSSSDHPIIHIFHFSHFWSDSFKDLIFILLSTFPIFLQSSLLNCHSNLYSLGHFVIYFSFSWWDWLLIIFLKFSQISLYFMLCFLKFKLTLKFWITDSILV